MDRDEQTAASAEEIQHELRHLVGLRLSIARRGADMRIFHFGAIRTVKNGTVGQYALHIQCPWRIEGPDGIVTGRMDLYSPAEAWAGQGDENFDYEKVPNLQDRKMEALFGGIDPQTRSLVNATGRLVVEAVKCDRFGGLAIDLSGGYRLAAFPAGTDGEDWRLFRPDKKDPHIVVEGGRYYRDS